jgi:hypothetical protein
MSDGPGRRQHLAQLLAAEPQGLSGQRSDLRTRRVYIRILDDRSDSGKRGDVAGR